MLAFLGYVVQTGVRGKGPTACLLDHVSDPMGQNIFTSWIAPGGFYYFLMIIAASWWREFYLYGDQAGEEKNFDTNVANDFQYKKVALFGIAPAYFLAAAYIAQIKAGMQAWEDAGLL